MEAALLLKAARVLGCRSASAVPGGGRAGPESAGPGRAEAAVLGTDGDSGEAEGRQGQPGA